MSVWILFVIGLNFGLIAAVAVLWVKVSRPQKDDPRLSKGLQLLQSKIAILEDLSDRSETQVNQLLKMMDNKIEEVKGLIDRSDEKLTEIDRSMQRSLEVAEIFEDKIPHEEIIERQNTKKYLQAAQLAHQGKSVDEISQQIDLSAGEIEIISKLNRDQMLVAQQEVPAWAQLGQDGESYQPVSARSEATEKLKKEFEQACRDHDNQQQEMEKRFEKFSQFEPNKFRQQVQSFVENIISDKKAEEGVDWVTPVENDPRPFVEPTAEPANTSSARIAEPQAPTQAVGEPAADTPSVVTASEALTKAPETTAFVESAESEPVKTIEVPVPPPAEEQLFSAADLQKAAEQSEPSGKFIRAEESTEVKKVKFPRIDI